MEGQKPSREQRIKSAFALANQDIEALRELAGNGCAGFDTLEAYIEELSTRLNCAVDSFAKAAATATTIAQESLEEAKLSVAIGVKLTEKAGPAAVVGRVDVVTAAVAIDGVIDRLGELGGR